MKNIQNHFTTWKKISISFSFPSTSSFSSLSATQNSTKWICEGWCSKRKSNLIDEKKEKEKEYPQPKPRKIPRSVPRSLHKPRKIYHCQIPTAKPIAWPLWGKSIKKKSNNPKLQTGRRPTTITRSTNLQGSNPITAIVLSVRGEI